MALAAVWGWGFVWFRMAAPSLGAAVTGDLRAVFGGLAFVDKVGAGPFNGLTLTANILTSLALDSFGLFGLPAAGFKPRPWLGGLLRAVGVTFIARVTPDKGTDSGGADAGHGLNPRLLYPFIVVAGALARPMLATDHFAGARRLCLRRQGGCCQ